MSAIVEFTQPALRRLFSKLVEVGVHTIADWDGGPGVLLRQDVDLDLYAARRFADLQLQFGLVSTFYILLTSPTYNCFSPQARSLLKSLSADGFEVGLHFDARYKDCSLQARVEQEAELLGDLCGQKVRSVSLHCPTSSGEYPLFQGFRNAYDPSLFGPDRYLSDSCMRWRHDPLEFVERGRTGHIQLLLHPLHYDGGYQPALKSWLTQFLATVDAEFRPVNPTYAAQIRADWLGFDQPASLIQAAMEKAIQDG
ncbi:MAG: hypothetical protein KC910_23155 [Candidatus Eremiobacteraeota bacterium]|nr:hypothetical protein [Candidatus Eremiobacteraeota bacterium]